MRRSPGSGSAAAPRRSAAAPRTPAGAPQRPARGSEAVTPPQPPNVTAVDGDLPPSARAARRSSARAQASAAKAGQAASFARLNDEKSELSMLIEDFFVDLAALPRSDFHPTHDLRWVAVMMVVDGLEHDEKLELQRYMLNCSGSSRTSDYVDMQPSAQFARRSALFGVSVELALAATLRGNHTRPLYNQKTERRETAEGKPRRIGTAREEYERKEMERLRSQARTANLGFRSRRAIARRRWKELTPLNQSKHKKTRDEDLRVYQRELSQWEQRKAEAAERPAERPLSGEAAQPSSSARARRSDSASDMDVAGEAGEADDEADGEVESVRDFDEEGLRPEELAAVAQLMADTLQRGCLKGHGYYITAEAAAEIEDKVESIHASKIILRETSTRKFKADAKRYAEIMRLAGGLRLYPRRSGVADKILLRELDYEHLTVHPILINAVDMAAGARVGTEDYLRLWHVTPSLYRALIADLAQLKDTVCIDGLAAEAANAQGVAELVRAEGARGACDVRIAQIGDGWRAFVTFEDESDAQRVLRLSQQQQFREGGGAIVFRRCLEQPLGTVSTHSCSLLVCSR